jgi:serine/threonine protein kinase
MNAAEFGLASILWRHSKVLKFDVAASFPQKIDRFNIRKVLGRGSQGIVYLADDPELRREVAIKSVNLKAEIQRNGNIEQLLSEARAVSKLQHANIVTIFDIGMLDENPYLVLEYIDGESLQKLIPEDPGMDQKMKILRDILSGVAEAHARNVIHCDIKPANILISQQGQAKVTDFGLALLADAAGGADDALYGTPQYMAPEYIETRQHQKVSDVFSIGLVGYELLTGKPAFVGNDVYQVINAIANTEVVPPSQACPGIDEGLDALILKSLEKKPDERYADANAMLNAFNNYLALDDTTSPKENSDATVKFLLRRMRHKKDFPVFSHTISVLNQASTSDTESLTTVSNTILKDYSLTNKVLRLVNSAHYNRGGGKISTISRAVVMLGINPVRSIATGLMLFEHMQNKLQSSQLKENAVQALFSGLLANSLAKTLGIPNHEEAFLCALLQQLGKMLVCFYLHEEAQAIDKLMLQQDCGEAAAVTRVIGISYPRLGMSVAREWGFPKPIIDSMLPLDFDNLKGSGSQDELQLIAQFSNALAACLALPLEQQATEIKKLSNQFSSVLEIDESKLLGLLENCHKELIEYSRLIQFDLDKSFYYQKISSSGSQQPELPQDSTQNHELGISDSVEILVERADPLSRSVEKVLTNGIQDITDTMTGEYNITQILQMIMETIYSAFNGSRVVLCLKDSKTGCIRARFGYGEDIEKFIDHFSLPLQDQSDVFHVALKNNVDIRIENTGDEKIRDRIPAWYHQNIAARSFTIFPILVNEAPIALIYIDSASAESIMITESQLGLIKTLRNQAILALKSRA